MANEQLRAYVKSQLARGVKPEAVKAAVLKVGWPAKDVEEVMQEAAPAAVSPAVPVVPAAPAASSMPSMPAISSAPSTPAAAPAENLPNVPSIPAGPVAPKASPFAASPLNAPPAGMPPSIDSALSVAAMPSPPSNALPRAESVPTAEKSFSDSLQIPIEPAVSAPEIVPINVEPEPKAAKPAGHVFSPLLAGIVFIVCVAIAGIAVWYFTSGEAPPPPSTAESQNFSNVTPTPAVLPEEEIVVATSTPPAEDPDIVAAKEAFEKIREANTKKDAALEKQYLSKQTLTKVASSPKWQPMWQKDFEFVSAAKESDAIIVMNIISVKESGATSSAETVFVKEAGGWKLGISETLERTLRPKVMATSTALSVATTTATSTKPTATSTAQ